MRQQRENQRVGARRAADRVLHVAVLGEPPLQRVYFGAEHEALPVEHAVHGLVHLVLYCLVLGPQVQQWNNHLLCHDGLPCDAERG